MLFAGREREKKQIIESLRHGKNIILGGKFGIGRTRLVKEIANLLFDETKFLFVDFGLTPWKMSEIIMKGSGLSARFKKTGKKMGYKSMLYRIANIQLPKRKKTVIVFDNVSKLTPQKIIFLRHLISEKHFQFIAIVENFLTKNDLFSMEVQLLPAITIYLSNLNTKAVINFLGKYSDKYHLNWSDAYIHNIAALTGGYPLSIIEMIRSKRESCYLHD
jgi:hypothetical protein